MGPIIYSFEILHRSTLHLVSQSHDIPCPSLSSNTPCHLATDSRATWQHCRLALCDRCPAPRLICPSPSPSPIHSCISRRSQCPNFCYTGKFADYVLLLEENCEAGNQISSAHGVMVVKQQKADCLPQRQCYSFEID